MDRFDGTAARQLPLLDEGEGPRPQGSTAAAPRARLRVLRKDIYAELARRRRQAQMKARRLVEK